MLPPLRAFVVLALAFLAFCVNSASASTVLFTTMGPNGQFDGTNGWILGGFDLEAMADAFTPAATAKLGDAVLILQYNSYYPDNLPVQVYLEADLAGQPGTILDTLTQSGTLTILRSPNTFQCTTCPVLQAGTQYWLAAVQTDTNSVDGWTYSYGDQLGLSAVNFAGSPTGPWVALTTTLSAFRVDAATPEPTSLLLMCTVAAAIIGLTRRKTFLHP
jgi:hypothetical protein